MKIGDRVFVRGYIDEIRKDTVIIRNAGGYFGTIPSEVITGELPSAQLDVPDTDVGDMISRQAAIERLMAQNVIMDGSEYHNGFNAGVNRAQEVIKNLPPVQPKHGKWIPVTNGRGGHECDQCHNYAPSYANGTERLSDFCPDCGADMRTKETDCDYERAVEQLEHDMLYEPTFDPDDGSM